MLVSLQSALLLFIGFKKLRKIVSYYHITAYADSEKLGCLESGVTKDIWSIGLLNSKDTSSG